MKDPIFYRDFSYNRELLPNEVLRELEEGVENIDQAVKRSGLTIGYPGWGLLYYLVMTACPRDRPVTIIETGTNVGCSTIVLAQALKDSGIKGQVHSIELDPGNHAQAAAHVNRANLSDCVTLIQGNSIEVLPGLLQDLESVDVAFLDGSHLEEHVLKEFELVEDKLSANGIVLFDNTYPIAEETEDQRVFGALKKIKAISGGNIIHLDFVSWYTPGLAIWQRS